MTRPKPGESGRGRHVSLPPWWFDALRREIGDRPIMRLAEDLTAAVRRNPPFRREAVYDFLDGKVTTDVMMGAFLVLFPDLPPPVFFANSYEEAHKHQQIARRYAQPKMDKSDVPKVTETIEDTGERPARSAETTGKRSKLAK